MVQIPMSTIEALAFRRSQFARVKNEFNKITRPGVYLLLGINPEDLDSPEFSFSGAGFSAKAIVSGTTGNWLLIKPMTIGRLIKQLLLVPARNSTGFTDVNVASDESTLGI